MFFTMHNYYTNKCPFCLLRHINYDLARFYRTCFDCKRLCCEKCESNMFHNWCIDCMMNNNTFLTKLPKDILQIIIQYTNKK